MTFPSSIHLVPFLIVEKDMQCKMYQYKHFNAQLFTTITTKILYRANLKLLPNHFLSLLPVTLVSTTCLCLCRLDYCNSSWNQNPTVFISFDWLSWLSNILFDVLHTTVCLPSYLTTGCFYPLTIVVRVFEIILGQTSREPESDDVDN